MLRRYVLSAVFLIAVTTASVCGLAMAAEDEVVAEAPDVRWHSIGGNPEKTGYTLLRRVEVPEGQCMKVVHTNALAEKHSPPSEWGVVHTDAGEFTVMVGDIAQSSLETNNGIAYQGQGARNVTLLPGSHVDIGIWLRPGKNPVLYYYAVTMVGELYPCA